MRHLLLSLFIFAFYLTDAQVISTFAGNGALVDTGDGGLAVNAGLNRPYGAVFDKAGNLYTVQPNTHKVRKISAAGIITTIAGTGVSGFAGDGGYAVNAQLNVPRWVDVDTFGNIYIADGSNNRIRKIDPNGIINTIAGNGMAGYNGDNIAATSASLIVPSGVHVDSAGCVYISEGGRIRKVDNNGIITTVVGTGVVGYSGDGGLAIAAQINAYRVYVDVAGNLTIVDQYRIRRVDAVTGIINTIAGTGIAAYNGDGIPATTANINDVALAWSANGDMFIADLANDRVRMVDNAGIIHTVAGTGTAGFSGDGGLATLAEMFDPTGVAFDSCWNLYIPCKENHRIRKVTYNDSCGITSARVVSKVGPSVAVYPNPAMNIIVVDGDVSEVYFCNAVGQVLMRKKVNGMNTELDIAYLLPGIYFVTVTDERGAKVTKKIVKE